MPQKNDSIGVIYGDVGSTEFNFTVDACASDKNHLLPKYWTENNSALDKNWDNEIVYCHPMYDIYIPKFIKKAIESKCITVFLFPSSTNAEYFHSTDPARGNRPGKEQVDRQWRRQLLGQSSELEQKPGDSLGARSGIDGN